ncbi:integrase [Pseudorhodobacter sp.]|uniref:integrase n=1 Tax=Pseudorhodobacter sp. TaxID=1934400 RepID=UPI002AFF2010|nr:integrase [Pseudorhodobacter sp.]
MVKGSHVWRDLATQITRAQIDALKQTLRRDKGNYAMQALDPLLKPPTSSDRGLPAVPLKLLFQSYIVKSQALGTHRDGGASWKYPLDSLIKFLGHSDARKITGQNLLDWRDSLLASGKSAKTVSDKYLAAIRAVLTWAFKEKRLPSNEADTVHQKVGKKIHSRERGYTKPEAVEILKVTTNYQPAKATNPSNRKSEHITRAKRWVPLLCAFTGARVTEMTQLRKEDIRQEDDRWILRVTPDAGSVKTGHYRDVPLHSQILDLGFIEFLRTVQAGPLFHRAQRPEAFMAGARATSGRLSEWLQSRNLVPEGVQPSYGWRHRFKTQGRELGMSDRVLDAIQGHASRTSGDDYGDITILARSRMIDALPSYDLGR